MNIICLDAETLKAGKLAFCQYRAAVLCGPSADIYLEGMCRQTGLDVVPGAIAACIDHGLVAEDEITNAAARVSRCTRSTVLKVLYALCGTDPERCLWAMDREGNFRRLAASRAKIFLAA